MTEASGRVQGAVTVYQPITVLDITETSFRLEAPFALQNDSLHDFRLALGSRSVIAKGRVTRCQVGELRDGVVYACTVEFVDPAPHVISALRDFIAAHQPPPPSIVDGEIAG